MPELPAKVEIGTDEIEYLCAAVSAYFKKPVVPSDVVWSYAGVRPLYNDSDATAQEVTRDYVLARSGNADGPVLLNIFGGKITTFRRLAEDALEKLSDCFPVARKAWTSGATLPGGDFPTDGFETLVAGLATGYPLLDAKVLRRLARAYGTRTRTLLGDATDMPSLGQHFGDTLYAREVAYLVEAEWATTADDILWRRSKLGLKIDKAGVEALRAWLEENLSAKAAGGG